MAISSSSIPGSGGLVVTPRMRTILEQPGFLGCSNGAETLRHLYCDREPFSLAPSCIGAD